MPGSTPGVGILGVSPKRGWAATAHIPALRALPDCEIRAIGAHSADSARAAGEAFGVSAVFSDHDQLLARPDLDVVAVARHETVAAIEKSAASGQRVKA
jgi:predicted dehydrogenase